MRTFFFYILCTTLATYTFKTNAQESDPVAHLEKINSQLKPIMENSWQYMSSVAHSRSAKKTENRRKELVASVSNAKKVLAANRGYKGDTAFKDSVMNFLNINYLVLNNDYAKIVDLEAIAEESYDNMEAYLMAQKLAGEKLDAAAEMMSSEEKRFAERYNIKLIDTKTKLSSSLEKVSDVIDYYNQVYLIFFKSNKQEVYMTDALNKNNINAFEQNKNALIATAKEGLAKIDTIKAFRGDITLKTSCKKLLQFYLDEGENKAASISDFLLKKENFEKQKKSFEAKSQKSQADVDQYNKAANEMNIASNKYNLAGNELNKNRQMNLDNWNKTVDSFMSRHIPKYSK